MASGDPVVQIREILPPASSAATIDTRAGGSSPAESVMVRDFPAGVLTYLDYRCRLVSYGNNGLTFSLPWSASTAISGTVRFGVAIRRIQDDAEDVDASHTYDFNDVDDTAASASGELSYPTVTFTDGADMDNWANGEEAIVRVWRNGTHANDNMSGDAVLWGFFGKET